MRWRGGGRRRERRGMCGPHLHQKLGDRASALLSNLSGAQTSLSSSPLLTMEPLRTGSLTAFSFQMVIARRGMSIKSAALTGLAALMVLCCTLGAAYVGRRPLARGMGRSNELLQLVASPCAGVGVGGGQQLAASFVVGQRQRMILCDTSVSTSLPAPYDYFTTREVGAPVTHISDPITPCPLTPASFSCCSLSSTTLPCWLRPHPKAHPWRKHILCCQSRWSN